MDTGLYLMIMDKNIILQRCDPVTAGKLTYMNRSMCLQSERKDLQSNVYSV